MPSTAKDFAWVSPRQTWIGLAAAGAVFLWAWFAELPLGSEAQRLLAVFLAVVVLWVSEALPIAATALLVGPALVVTRVCDARTAFAPYADPMLFIFIGGFLFAKAMTRHGLDRRIAHAVMSLRSIRKAPWRVRAGFVVTGALLSMWMSNTATTAVLVPILLNTVPRPGELANDRAVAASLLAVAYGNSIGGLGTPVGSPPNLVAMRFLGEAGVDFSFFDWVRVGLPVSILLIVAMLLLFQFLAPATEASTDFGEASTDFGEDGKPRTGRTPETSKGKMTKAQRATAFAFGLAVLGWMTPGLLRAAGVPGADAVRSALPASAVAILAAGLLFFFRDDEEERVLPWADANQIEWGIVILFGGGISLGVQMNDTGLAGALSRGFLGLTGVEDVWTLTALVTVFTVFFTEACSNVATSNMVAPLLVAMSQELGVSPIPPMLAAGLAASCAFILPIATAPNAIAYSTGRVPRATMMRYGWLLNLLAAGLIWCALRVLVPLYGWM